MTPAADHDMVRALHEAIPLPDPGELAGLRERLARAAADGDLLDVAHRCVDSPFGPLLVAVTGTGVARLAFEREGHDRVLDELARTVSPRILTSGARTDPVALQLEEYFAGRRRHFDVPLDLRLIRGFRRQVLDELLTVEFGRVVSYADLARSVGNPGAARAAGSACSHNPVPVIVPCHRVVRSDGTIGQYLGGTEVKAALLAFEAGS